MGHITHTAMCAAPVEFAFDYTTDHRNVPKWMLGMDRLDPIGEQTRGVGSVFEGAVDLGPTTLHLRLDFTEWTDNEVFALALTGKGIEGNAVWHFAPEEDKTRMRAEVNYTVSGGIAGKVLDKIIQAFATLAIRHIDKHLRRQIEAGYLESLADSQH